MSFLSPASARQIIRNYGFERFRGGRSKFKSVINKILPAKVDAELAKGFSMELDLTVDRQAYDFYHPEADEPASSMIENYATQRPGLSRHLCPRQMALNIHCQVQDASDRHYLLSGIHSKHKIVRADALDAEIAS